MIDYLHRAPARVVAVDLTLAERDRVAQYEIGDVKWSGKESDQALADSVKTSGNVVMLADAVDEPVIGAAPSAPDVGGPRAIASAIVPSSGRSCCRRTLSSPTPAQRSGTTSSPSTRTVPRAAWRRSSGRGSSALPSLGLAAALMAEHLTATDVRSEGNGIRIGDRSLPLLHSTVVDSYDRTRHDQWTMLINYRAPALLADGVRPYRSYAFRRLFMSEQQLLAGEKPMVDPAEFKDTIVFIGLTGSGLIDVFNSPFGDDHMPGIQLHASMADSVLAGRFIAPASSRSRIATVLIVAIAVGFLSAFLPFSAAAGAAAAILAGWSWFALSAFRSGSWLNMVQPLAAGAITLFAGTAYQYFVEDREKRKMKRLFGRYVSRDVYDQLTAHPELAELGGKRREMTVLFSDIRGFTAVTEQGNPEALVAQLNEYFSRMVDIVFRLQRDGGQIRRRHGDGTLRRPARRSRPRRARGCRRQSKWCGSWAS